MVAYDHFTKYVFVKPLVKATSKNIIRRLIKIFSTTGYPKYLVADNAKYFINKIFRTWVANQGIKMKYVSPYHPSSNACERANRTVRNMLSIMIGEDNHAKWVEQLSAIELALRTAINSSTGFSPAELYLGRRLKLPIDNVLERIGATGKRENELTNEEVFGRVTERVAKRQKANAYYYNRKRNDVTFQTGDKVILKNGPLSVQAQGIQAKLLPKYRTEIYVIGKVYSPLTYELLDDKNISCGWHHI